jgi:hypothetical protein
MLSEIACHQKTHIVWYYLCEVPGVDKFIETGSGIEVTGTGDWGNDELVFGVYSISVWDNGCAVLWDYLMPLTCMVKIINFMLLYFTTV